MGKTNGDTFVLQQTVVIRLLKTEDLSKNKTLQGSKRSLIKEAVQSGLPLLFERLDERLVGRLQTRERLQLTRGGDQRTSLAKAAIPKTRFSSARAFLSERGSELLTNPSYNVRKAGRCSTGKRGAHSWKKMLISWSETRRGGAFQETGDGSLFCCGDLVSVSRKASGRIEGNERPVSWTRRLKASVHVGQERPETCAAGTYRSMSSH